MYNKTRGMEFYAPWLYDIPVTIQLQYKNKRMIIEIIIIIMNIIIWPNILLLTWMDKFLLWTS
jgi:hypothetical protein